LLGRRRFGLIMRSAVRIAPASSRPTEDHVDPAHLRKIPVFSDLDNEELSHIAALAAEVSVPAGKELVRQGDYSYDVLAIEEGTATVEREGARIADLGPGDVVGEMGVLERSQRNATVRATSPMRLVTLTGWDIRRLRKSAPHAVAHLRSIVAQRREHA
jgi:CRP/FNR family transcriptional regulator, cyclic AMP receptor protein